jgi:acyl-coenzyme A thioesterase PaaI-like protein
LTSEATGARAASPAGVADRATPDQPLRDARGAFEFEPHHCFACGELNEHGLQLRLHTDPTGSWTELTLAPRFQGWEAVAHGGIICTILDEVMAWSVIGRGTWGVTARLTATFKRPISTGQRIRAEGWVVDQDRRATRAAGHVLDAASGEVLATGESTFIAVPPDQLERLQRRYGMRRIPSDPIDAETTETADAVDRPQAGVSA